MHYFGQKHLYPTHAKVEKAKYVLAPFKGVVMCN